MVRPERQRGYRTSAGAQSCGLTVKSWTCLDAAVAAVGRMALLTSMLRVGVEAQDVCNHSLQPYDFTTFHFVQP